MYDCTWYKHAFVNVYADMCTMYMFTLHVYTVQCTNWVRIYAFGILLVLFEFPLCFLEDDLGWEIPNILFWFVTYFIATYTRVYESMRVPLFAF